MSLQADASWTSLTPHRTGRSPTRQATASVFARGQTAPRRNHRTAPLDFGQQLQAVHAGHVDVGEHGEQFGLDFTGEAVQSLLPRGGIMEDIHALTGLATKTLTK